MANSAVHLRDRAMRVCGDADMTLGTLENAVHGFGKGLLVNEARHAFFIVAFAAVLCANGSDGGHDERERKQKMET